MIVASFASHVHRIQQIIDVAHAHNRRVTFVGRSMVRNMQIAQDLGYLSVPDRVVVDLDTAATLPDHRVVLISTGSQGKTVVGAVADGARRTPADQHPRRRPRRPCLLADPGRRELCVRGGQRPPAKRGATVITQQSAKVHVSGHASAGELLYRYNAVRPTNVMMPVHGVAAPAR